MGSESEILLHGFNEMQQNWRWDAARLINRSAQRLKPMDKRELAAALGFPSKIPCDA